MQNQIEHADFVLVVCTALYERRFRGLEPPGVGLGATWEGGIINQLLFESGGRNEKFIPVVFFASDIPHIPVPLRATTRYDLSSDDEYKKLYLRITGQAIEIPQVGSTVLLENLERKQDFLLSKWNLPYQRNPFFTGREDILQRLDVLFGPDPSHQVSVALVGTSGVGKTQIAIEYSYRRRDLFDFILWASANSRESLISSFVGMAHLLNLPQKDLEDQNLLIAAVKKWLETRRGWLLVLDNVTDFSTVEDFLRQGQGHVLATTKIQAIGEFGHRVEIGTMAPQEGAMLVFRRARLVDTNARPGDIDASDLNAATELTQELGHLPLALDQAGAYIEETSITVGEYIDLYKSHSGELLKRRGTTSSAHPDSVVSSVQLSLQQLEQVSPPAAELLRFCAFLGKDIPEKLLAEGAPELGLLLLRPVLSDALKLNETIADILKFSLLQRNPKSESLIFHQLVQISIRETIDSESRRSWAERAIRVVNRSFPASDFKNWGWCEQLLPHVEVCAGLIREFVLELEESAQLLGKASLYLRDRVRMEAAETYQKQSLELWQKVAGENEIPTATAHHNLGFLYKTWGKHGLAEMSYEQALEIRRDKLPSNHPDTATTLNNVAVLYLDQGKVEDAERFATQAYEIRLAVYGHNHVDTASSLNNLGRVLYEQGRYSEAEIRYTEALDVWKSQTGEEHPEFAKVLDNLATAYAAQQKYTDAILLHQEAVMIRERTLGAMHPELAMSLNNLGAVYRKVAKYDEAEALYQRSLSIWETAFGLEHPHVAQCLNNIGVVHFQRGNLVEAEKMYDQALALKEKILGLEHPEVAITLHNLADCYAAQGKYEKSARTHQRVLSIRERVLPPDHPYLILTLSSYAAVLRELGRDDEASALEVRAAEGEAKRKRRGRGLAT